MRFRLVAAAAVLAIVSVCAVSSPASSPERIVRAQAEPMIEENIAVAKGDKATAQLQPLLAVPLQDLANAPPPEQNEPEPAARSRSRSPRSD